MGHLTSWHAALLFLAVYGQVALLGFQSRNVNTGQYVSAAVTSVLIGTAQLFAVRAMVLSDPIAVWCVTSIAGPAGILSAMVAHRRLFGARS